MKKLKPNSKPAAKTIPEQRGRPFRPGVSGNPNGRPQGSRNKATIALQTLLDGEGVQLTRACIELALSGDVNAMRLCMERLIPPTKERRIKLSLPPIQTAADVAGALSQVLKAVGDGRITPGEGQTLAEILEGRRRTIETQEFEERLAVLEKGKS